MEDKTATEKFLGEVEAFIEDLHEIRTAVVEGWGLTREEKIFIQDARANVSAMLTEMREG